jgi:DNA-binding beta-propeller fold protein YncE
MIPTGKYPDGLAYSPITQTVFVSNQFGNSNTVIGTKTLQPIATIDLGGEVGNTQYDPVPQRIFAAVQTHNQLVAIDPRTNRVVGRYDTPGCDRPHGLLIPNQKQTFIACEDNATLVVFSLTTMKVCPYCCRRSEQLSGLSASGESWRSPCPTYFAASSSRHNEMELNIKYCC